jgi:hypothetical protein
MDIVLKWNKVTVEKLCKENKRRLSVQTLRIDGGTVFKEKNIKRHLIGM